MYNQLRGDEEFVIGAIANFFSAVWWASEDPPDAYLKVGDQDVAVEISNLMQNRSDGRGGTRSRLSTMHRLFGNYILDNGIEMSESVKRQAGVKVLAQFGAALPPAKVRSDRRPLALSAPSSSERIAAEVYALAWEYEYELEVLEKELELEAAAEAEAMDR